MNRALPLRLPGSLLLALIALSPAARANVLLTNVAAYGGFHYGGAEWDGFTALLDSQFSSVVTVADLANPASFSGVDAVLFAPRIYGSAPTGSELANLAGFIASGKRILMVGENDNWTAWDNGILSLVGSSYQSWYYGWANAVLTHDLTAGVPKIYLPSSGLTTGGTPLFDRNFATLWGPSQSVLTVLDVSVFDDDYGTGPWQSSYAWQSNVAAWLAGGHEPAPVPEPGTLALLGLGGLAVARRKRRR